MQTIEDVGAGIQCSSIQQHAAKNVSQEGIKRVRAASFTNTSRATTYSMLYSNISKAVKKEDTVLQGKIESTKRTTALVATDSGIEDSIDISDHSLSSDMTSSIIIAAGDPFTEISVYDATDTDYLITDTAIKKNSRLPWKRRILDFLRRPRGERKFYTRVWNRLCK